MAGSGETVRPLVAASWMRSIATGVDPHLDGAPSSPEALDRAAHRDDHPLAPALPVIDQLLVSDAADDGAVVAVFAADGTLLWVDGDRSACRTAESMNFVPGTDWSEQSAGTSAPGTALALDRELRIAGPEHFAHVARRWSCSAVPIHEPGTGAMIGAIDLTGGDQVASPTAVAWVRATAVAVEQQLALLRLRPVPADASTAPRLTVLGTERARWQVTDANGQLRRTTLSRRHAELLILLSRHPDGLTTEQLAAALDERNLDAVTVRAELSRLRRVVGDDVVGSRPYRLLKPVVSDVGATFAALAARNAHTAMDAYSGPLLAQSTAPMIASIRRELSSGVRSAVLTSGDLPLLRRWLNHPDGRDDREGWRTLRDRSPAGSTDWVRAGGQLAGIDFELG